MTIEARLGRRLHPLPVRIMHYRGDWRLQVARVLHFTGIAIVVGFLVIHVALALLVPQTLKAMLTGEPRVAARS